MRNAGFFDLDGVQLPDEAPDRLQERWVAIVPEEVALGSGSNALSG